MSADVTLSLWKLKVWAMVEDMVDDAWWTPSVPYRAWWGCRLEGMWRSQVRWIPVVFALACSGGTDTSKSEEAETVPSDLPSDDTSTPSVSNEDTGEQDTSVPVDTGDSVADTGGVGVPEGWRSALFPDDWTPGFGVAIGAHVAQLQDFSYAGYRAGEGDLPAVSLEEAVSVLDFGADPTGVEDSGDAVQAAIDAVAAADGGVVYLPTGTYRIDDLLRVTHSGTVIVGDGPGATRIGFTRHDGMTDTNHLQFTGALTAGSSTPLAVDGAVGDTILLVDDATDFDVGDEVGVGMVISDAFREEHEMDSDGRWGFSAGQRRTIFKRTIVAIDREALPQQITIDVPLRYPMKTRDEADIRQESGAITECGVQDLSVSTAVDWDAAWANDRSHAIGFSDAKDCWARGIESWPGTAGDGEHHLQSGGILIKRSRRMTVADAELAHAQNRGGGGNGYLFELMQSDEILVRDSVGRAGRHNFIQNWDFGTTGCVFLRTLSEDGEAWGDPYGFWTPMGASEYHHALAMANLVDSSEAHDGWAAKNRMHWSSGAGHSATQCVFWNTRGTGSLESLQYGLGYVIGTEDLDVRTEVLDVFDSAGTSPEDWVEGLNEGDELWPPSLYEEQRLRRLGG